jgi:CHAT domain-containing protein
MESSHAMTAETEPESVRESGAFSLFIEAAHALASSGEITRDSLSAAAFERAQWAMASRAGDSLREMAARLTRGDPDLSKMVRERQDLLKEWRRLDERAVSMGADRMRSVDSKFEVVLGQISAIEHNLAELDKSLAARFPEFTALESRSTLSISGVQALLRRDEAVVLIFLASNRDFQDGTFVWTITQREAHWYRPDRLNNAEALASSALTEKVQALRCGLDSEEWEGISRPARCGRLLGMRARPRLADPLPFDLGIAHELYDSLLGPVEDLIKDKHLIIVPSGPLTSLPFQVLVTEQPASTRPKTFEGYKGVAWLGRRQPLTILPSVASLQALRKFAKASTAEKPYLGYGDPVLLGDGGCRRAITRAACTPPLVMASANGSMPPRERSDVRSGSIDRIYRRGAGQEAVISEVRTLCPLPDTAFELRCVAKSLGVPESEIRLGPSSTEADIKRLSETHELENYRVIHFATHGLLAGDTEAMARRQGEPALVMTPPDHPVNADDDGLLTASEVAQLRLNADWVILSACNTAAGDKLGAEALSGLARAFFYAGARALLVSHWPVYSDAAVQLLDKTFAELRQDKNMGRSEALRRALVDLMDDPHQDDNPHPSIWAPFSLAGEGAQ